MSEVMGNERNSLKKCEDLAQTIYCSEELLRFVLVMHRLTKVFYHTYHSAMGQDGESGPQLWCHWYHPRGIILVVILWKVYIPTTRKYMIALHWW